MVEARAFQLPADFHTFEAIKAQFFQPDSKNHSLPKSSPIGHIEIKSPYVCFKMECLKIIDEKN